MSDNCEEWTPCRRIISNLAAFGSAILCVSAHGCAEAAHSVRGKIARRLRFLRYAERETLAVAVQLLYCLTEVSQ